MLRILIISSLLLSSVFAGDFDSGISSGSGLEATNNELANKVNIQYYKNMATSMKKHATKTGRATVTEKGKGVGNVYVEKGKNVVNITEVKEGAVIIQE